MKNRILLLLAATTLMTPAATAQWSTANFDVVPEGAGTTHYVEDNLRFDNLDLYDGSGPTSPFSIEDASANLGSFPDFTSPNTLDTGPVIPGTIGTAGRIGSFRILPFSEATRAEVRLYVIPGSSAGNQIVLEASLGATVIETDAQLILAGGWTQMDFEIVGVTFDRLRIYGEGPNNGGAFFALVDEVSVLRARQGTEYCFGDGTAGPCPCANFGGPIEGCLNSTGLGAYALGYGSASLTLDNLEIASGQLPPNRPALMFSGPFSIDNPGLTFGDGVRCVAGSLKRHGVVFADAAGLATWDQDVLTTSTASAGSSHYFQVWYRDNNGPCGNGNNVSSALEVLVSS